MNSSLTRAWNILGIAALLASGLLAVLVSGAKMPGIKQLVDIEFIRWCLVVHVNLSTLVWFTALPMGLLYFATKSRNALSTRMSWIGFALSMVGALLLFSVPPQDGVRAILSNYIPILSHERYYWGLAIYLLGIVIGILSPKIFVDDAKLREKWPGLFEIRFGLIVGSAFLMLAAVALGLSFYHLSKIQMISEIRFFELGMWGGGHMIQHAAAVFTVCCWVIFLSRRHGRPILNRSSLFGIFAWMGLPIFLVPVILYFDVTSSEYREGFTFLMQWGIAPPILLFLVFALRRFSFRRSDLKNYEVMAFVMSALLLIMGFIFGGFIRGADMRVPGHYHASIGAVTLALMALGYSALASVEGRWVNRSVWWYGIGQAVFAGGMFMAGAFGMARKTYGSEHQFTHWGQSLGIGVMAIGGILALIGGILFAIAIVPHLGVTRSLRGQAGKAGNGLNLKFESEKKCLNIKGSHG